MDGDMGSVLHQEYISLIYICRSVYSYFIFSDCLLAPKQTTDVKAPINTFKERLVFQCVILLHISCRKAPVEFNQIP